MLAHETLHFYIYEALVLDPRSTFHKDDRSSVGGPGVRYCMYVGTRPGIKAQRIDLSILRGLHPLIRNLVDRLNQFVSIAS